VMFGFRFGSSCCDVFYCDLALPLEVWSMMKMSYR
jgi:hypothetical protein